MATFATNTNLTHMNIKQLRAIAQNVGVAPVTINAYLSQNSGKTGLISAIKAK